MKNKREEKRIKNKDVIDREVESIITDPNGSWTGVSVDDPLSKPIQDADDL